jgi:tetratricopeptide (TPR) repeat protein
MTAPENSNLESVLADVRELRKTLEFEKEVQSIRADMTKDLSALRKDFSDLKTEVKVESNFYRWVGASSIFVAIILGALGISQWRDVIGRLRAEVEKTSEYQSNLARGLALANGKRPEDATTYLRKCYEITPKDQAVAGTLLWSYQQGDDWEKAVPLAIRLKADFGIDGIRDPWIINNIGQSLLYEGQSDSTKRDEAKLYFERAAANLKGDSEERDVWENLWVYHLFTNEVPEAEDCLKRAVAAQSTKGIRNAEDWQNETKWSLFQYLQKANKTMEANAKKTIADVVK